MSEPIRYKSIQEPLDDEERELMDPDTWDWDNPVEVVVHPDFGFIFPIRFTGEEVARLEPAARADGLSPHKFIKQAALAWLPLDEEERELMNHENWDWDNPVEGVTVREPAVTIRFTREQYMALGSDAEAQGLTVDELIKQAALARLPQDVPR
ncbi:MAG: hypothetical protein K0Q71_4901 [Thermomicrobiales bacterium]|jgi:hypothetical protein|nr:hypothetical protein [Thermomicrobiales bacterium]